MIVLGPLSSVITSKYILNTWKSKSSAQNMKNFVMDLGTGLSMEQGRLHL